MKFKHMITASCLTLVSAFSLQTHASESFKACVSTPSVTFEGTVVDAAIATPELSILVDAVVAAGLADALAEAEDITVYAPTNDAFTAIPGPVLDAILADVDLLTTVLTYHVTPGVRDPRNHFKAVARPTLAGPFVYYDFNNGHSRVNQSAVSCTGVRTDNGIVWVIDSVLLPQF